MVIIIHFSSLIFVLLYTTPVIGVEFTFELEDNSKQCFFEDIKQGTRVTLDFQVCLWCKLQFQLVYYKQRYYKY